MDASVQAINVEPIVLSFNMVIRGRPESPGGYLRFPLKGLGAAGIPEIKS